MTLQYFGLIVIMWYLKFKGDTMTRFTTILMTGVTVLAFTACGGGSSSNSGGTNQPPAIPKESPIIKSSDAPRHIDIPIGEKVILGGGALITSLYNANGEYIFKSTNKVGSKILTEGSYTLTARESTMIYNDGEGMLFYVSSNIGVEDLPLNSTINIPKRAARIYKLNVEYESMYLIETSRLSAYVFNSSLNKVTYTDNVVTLTPGLYYFVVDTRTFIVEGRFSVTPM